MLHRVQNILLHRVLCLQVWKELAGPMAGGLNCGEVSSWVKKDFYYSFGPWEYKKEETDLNWKRKQLILAGFLLVLFSLEMGGVEISGTRPEAGLAA